MTDPFRPRRDPARTIYDAFQAEAALRGGRDVDAWRSAERQAVWQAAWDYAQQHNLVVPTLSDVEDAEVTACGHTDYGAKWAHGVAGRMHAADEEGSL